MGGSLSYSGIGKGTSVKLPGRIFDDRPKYVPTFFYKFELIQLSCW